MSPLTDNKVTEAAHSGILEQERVVPSERLQGALAVPLFNLCLLQNFGYSSPVPFIDSLNKNTGSATSSLCDLE